MRVAALSLLWTFIMNKSLRSLISFSNLSASCSISHCSIIISFSLCYFSSSSHNFWNSKSLYYILYITPLNQAWILIILRILWSFIGEPSCVYFYLFIFYGEIIMSASSWSNYLSTSYVLLRRSFIFFSKYSLLFLTIFSSFSECCSCRDRSCN